jgi:hypothetical protein
MDRGTATGADLASQDDQPRVGDPADGRLTDRIVVEFHAAVRTLARDITDMVLSRRAQRDTQYW